MTWQRMWIRLRNALTGRGLARDLERNRQAADRLDAAVKEMFRK